MINKIQSINSLSKISIKEKKNGKKIVLCHGVFDLLHIGHIKHFEKAKSLGDILIVSITADNFVNKGPGRPAFNEEDRSEGISTLSMVDYVLINSSLTSTTLIKQIKPNIYCKGADYKNKSKDITGEIKNEIKAVNSVGGKIIFTGGRTFSSSNLINKFSDSLTKNQRNSLKTIKKKYDFSKIHNLIDKFKKLKVLVIGEAIIDQYVFCDALGKSGKEPVLALREIKSETYLGGALAITRHISQFCNKTDLFSMLGEKKEFLGDIKKNLSKNIKFDFIKKKNSPTIFKKRFVDHVSNSKVLGVYKINDDPLDIKEEKILNKKLENILPKYDAVIVSDYGHGFISERTAKLICTKSKFVSLNAQVNAANIGYHSMRKYKGIECLIINEKEIRHELRNRTGDVKILMKKLSKEQKIKNIVVTRGINGAILYNLKENIFKFSDAFAKKAIDKIGAGDAMLSVISLCLRSKFTNDLSLLTGSLAAAFSADIMGNKEPISKTKILKSIEHILK
jgi:rfaE bifunctional protein kinase chain/domain/rfaE bifunctional protein nucleotidyltransferase chain/domain